MSPLKVTCPRCQAELMAMPPFPPGLKAKCSQCGTFFPLTAPTMVRSHPTETSRAPVPVAVGVAPPRSVSVPPARTPWFAIIAVVGMVLIAGWIVTYVVARRLTERNDDVIVSHNDRGVEPETSDGRPEPLTLTAPEAEDGKARPRVYQPRADQRSRYEMPSAPTSLSAEKQEAVRRAIERGVAYLKRTQSENGTWGSQGHAVGYAALPGLTLLECGVPLNDPAVRRAADFVRREKTKLAGTYELGLSVLFLERLGLMADRPIVQELAARLIAGQLPDGGWTYRCTILDASQQETMLRQLTEMRTGSAADLLKPVGEGPPAQEVKAPKPNVGRPKGKSAKAMARLKNVPSLQEELEVRQEPNSATADNSNTQFAMLALWAAQRQGVPVERALALVAKRFRPAQNDEGGWGYNSGGDHQEPSTPSMTCVGLLALAVGHGLGRDDSPGRGTVQDDQIQNAMNALGKRVGKPATKAEYDLYFLWSLERVGVLYGLQKIGGSDWYAWGAEFLLGKQSKDGKWEGSHYHGASPTVDTCFALLFLKRANLTHDLKAKIGFLKIVSQSEQ